LSAPRPEDSTEQPSTPQEARENEPEQSDDAIDNTEPTSSVPTIPPITEAVTDDSQQSGNDAPIQE